MRWQPERLTGSRPRGGRRLLALALALCTGAAAAEQPAASPLPETSIPAAPPAAAWTPQAVSAPDPQAPPTDAPAQSPTRQPADGRKDFFSRLLGDEPAPYSIVSVARGLSTHKPMFILPVTYSNDYPAEHTEVIFQISAKHQLFNRPFYFGFSQRSFWQLYNGERSRPFRESDYNPEVFYRWRPDPERYHYWGADIGIEHESNGQDLPLSRSWNRVYVAPFRAKGKSLIYMKGWYRIPEEEKKTPDDPKGDDNPDIEDYMGYGELHFQRQIGRGQVIHSMIRLNPATGRGAINLNWTLPSRDGYLFYQLYVWHGYGESLLDYNDSVTRIGVGVALAR